MGGCVGRGAVVVCAGVHICPSVGISTAAA